MPNLETLFMLHARRDVTGNGCFDLVQDCIRFAKRNKRLRFAPPSYLDSVMPNDRVYASKRRFGGSLQKAWRAHLDNSPHLRRLTPKETMQPGDIAVSGEGAIFVNGVEKRNQDAVIGVISAGYEMVSRTNFGLCTVHPIAYVWRID